MKKILCILAATAVSGIVYAEMSPYVSGGIGYAGMFDSDVSWTGGGGEVSWDAGYVLEGAVGVGLDSIPARAEVALSYQKNDGDKFTENGVSMDAGADLSGLALMLNGYFDIQLDSPVTPYVLAGVGFTHAKLDFDEGGDETDTVLTGQVGVGAGYEVAENVIIDLKYKFIFSQDFEFTDEDGKNTVEMMGHQVQLGARYSF